MGQPASRLVSQRCFPWVRLANLASTHGYSGAALSGRQRTGVAVRRAFTLGFDDLEDAMQAVAAEACHADVIVTRNTADFAASQVPVLTPVGFLAACPAT